jgi:CHAT domain-containing protein/Tfp pilus assembly protein PilF
VVFPFIQFYKNGKELYYDGGYEKAIKQFEKAYNLQVKIYGEKSEPVMKSLYRLGQAYRKMRDHPAALKVYTQGLEIAQKISGEDSEDVIDFYWGLGATRSQMYDPKGAIGYYEKCLDAYSKTYGPESSEAGNMYMNIGSSFHKMANYHDAEKYYKRAFDIFRKSSDPKSQDFNRIYSNMGYMYRKVGNYDRAIDFGEKALEIKLLHYDSTHPSVGKYYRNIAKAYQGKLEYKKALPYMLKAVNNQEKALGKKHPETGGAYGELGNVYADLGEYKTALKYYAKARKIQEATLNPTHPYLIGGYFNIGTVYEDMGDYDKAVELYQFALKKFKSRVYPPQNLIAETQRKIATVLFQKGEIDSALVLIQLSLKEIAPGFTFEENDFYKNPDLKNIQDDPGFLYLLNSKSLFLEGKFKKNKIQSDLEEAFKTLELAIQLIEKMRKSYQSEESRQFLNSKTSPIYIKAVQLSFDLYDLTKNDDYLFKAFEISEKSKASILWQNLSENLALQSTSIPQKDLDVLNQLEVKIADLEEKLFDEQADETFIKNLQSQIFDLKLDYENRIAAIEKQNPKYFQLKYQAPDIELKKIINKLPNNATSIVEYFYDEDNLYAFVISKNGLSGAKFELKTSLLESIKLLRDNNVANLLKNNTDNESYISLLNELHRILIQPISEQLENIEKLILVPHGVLQYLPFEMLTPEEGDDFRKLDFLIRKYSIQYEWSIAFWLNEILHSETSDFQFLGFAPSFPNSNQDIAAVEPALYRMELAPLMHSVAEVKNANTYFPGNLFLANKATESNFLQNAPKSQIIHLATHALTDDVQPLKSGLAFTKDSIEDGFLNAYEIYNLNLPVDLAVMSACNTGYGQIAEGEGVMSLGRAFSYAGCKSVVMSLWLANDQSTSTLMENFYLNLSLGMAKDEALRKAKIDYLENADQLTAHPYFWAGMIAVGDMSPVFSNSFLTMGLLIFIGVILALILLFINVSARK